MNLARFGLRSLFGRRLPTLAGDIEVPGLSAPVVIRRDRFGVPHVEAESTADAWFGLGFCHGQDRAFQLETLLRVARGTLAELVGPPGLPVDRVSRRVGFFRAAAKQLLVQSNEVIASLTAYANGATAGATLGMGKPAHEFALLKAAPTPWTAQDVLAMLNLQSFLLPSNWDVELARLKILLEDGSGAVRDLDPVPFEAGDAPPPPELLEPLERFLDDLCHLEKFRPGGGGSNNFAIAGSRTLSGKPLLANDPHLPPTSPPPWYLAHVATPEWFVCGASLVGAPGIPVGHNGFACWGLTAGLTDTTDLFLETAKSDGAFDGAETIREVIRVKGAKDEIVAVVVTPRGPIITPLLGNVGVALSLQAVWLQPRPVRGLLDAAGIRDFEAFRRTFEQWPALPQNLLYADSAGTIGYQLIGQLPERESPSSLLPRRAGAPGSAWKPELVPFERMPFAKDPEAGYFATANARPPGDLDVGHDFCEPYRAEIILDELARVPVGWTVLDCQKLQYSVRSKPWEGIRDVVLKLNPKDSDARLSLELLRAWNGRVTADSAGATVYEFFVAEMCIRIAKARAPKAWQTAVGGGGHGPFSHNTFGDRRMCHLVRSLNEQTKGWFANTSWSEEMCDALAAVARRLRKRHGPGPRWWHWGDVRPLVPRHPLFGQHRLLGPAFNLPTLAVGGDTNTPNQAGTRPLAPTASPHMVPTMRAVFDTADFSESRYSLLGGQSGNPMSEHFDDQVSIWLRGEGIEIPFAPEEVLKKTVAAVRLVPAR